MFRSYFPLFIKLFMVLLCVIFKKRVIFTPGILSTPACAVYVRLITTAPQGSKLTLANSQNVSDFDNLRVRKISTSKHVRVRIIHVSQTRGGSRGRVQG